MKDEKQAAPTFLRPCQETPMEEFQYKNGPGATPLLDAEIQRALATKKFYTIGPNDIIRCCNRAAAKSFMDQISGLFRDLASWERLHGLQQGAPSVRPPSQHGVLEVVDDMVTRCAENDVRDFNASVWADRIIGELQATTYESIQEDLKSLVSTHLAVIQSKKGP